MAKETDDKLEKLAKESSNNFKKLMSWRKNTNLMKVQMPKRGKEDESELEKN